MHCDPLETPQRCFPTLSTHYLHCQGKRSKRNAQGHSQRTDSLRITHTHILIYVIHVTVYHRLVSQKRAYMGRERSRLSELGRVKTEAWRPAGKQRKEREARSVLSESTACCGQANEVQI